MEAYNALLHCNGTLALDYAQRAYTMTRGTSGVVRPATAYSRCLNKAGRKGEASAVVEEGLIVVDREGEPRESRLHILLLLTKASILQDEGKAGEALPSLKRAYDIMKGAESDRFDDAAGNMLWLDVLRRLGDVYKALGMEEEEKVTKEEMEVVERRAKEKWEGQRAQILSDHGC